MEETSLNAPSSDAAPLTSGSLPTALDVGRVAGATSGAVEETSLDTPSSDAAPPVMSPPPADPDTVQVARAAPKEAALAAYNFEASRKGKGKGKVSD